MRHKLKSFAAITFIIATIYGVFAWQKFRYNECREFGHSIGYCIGVVTR